MKMKFFWFALLLVACPILADRGFPLVGALCGLASFVPAIMWIKAFVEFHNRPRAEVIRVGWFKGKLGRGRPQETGDWEFDQRARWETINKVSYLCGWSVPELRRMAKRAGRYSPDAEYQPG